MKKEGCESRTEEELRIVQLSANITCDIASVLETQRNIILCNIAARVAKDLAKGFSHEDTICQAHGTEQD